MYLFFDTETTGLPLRWDAPVEDLDNWPRMIQIAWILMNDEDEVSEEKVYIIQPEGFSIPKAASDVHGISTEKALEEGHNIVEVLEEFRDSISKCSGIVAHNINFDEKIVGAEFLRSDIGHDFFSKERLCTMKRATQFCKIPGKYGYKWPKLIELHQKLFGVGFENAHDALVDIQACAKCFWKMRGLHLI